MRLIVLLADGLNPFISSMAYQITGCSFWKVCCRSFATSPEFMNDLFRVTQDKYLDSNKTNCKVINIYVAVVKKLLVVAPSVIVGTNVHGRLSRGAAR